MNSKQKTVDSEQFFECPECGLHYRDLKIAKQCETFCKANKACSMEIAKKAVEYELREKEVSDES